MTVSFCGSIGHTWANQPALAEANHKLTEKLLRVPCDRTLQITCLPAVESDFVIPRLLPTAPRFCHVGINLKN